MLREDLAGLGILLAYYILVAALPPLLFGHLFRLPFELVRKLHHIAYAMSIFILCEKFSGWQAAVLAAFALVLLAYPVLALLERFPFYRRVFVDREGKGELRRQLVYVQLSIATLLLIFWGLLGDEWRYVAVVAVMAWGFGDAAAALVGKAFGRHPIPRRLTQGTKTVEGTLAMYVAAGLAVFFTLLLYAGETWSVSLAVALLVAPVCAVVEMVSRRGSDTITVPLSAGLEVLSLMTIFSVLGA